MLRRRVPPALDRIALLARTLAARTPVKVSDPSRQRAAVAVVLVPTPGAVLLIRRAERVGDRWSGQMAFPGGRWSPDDRTLEETARRETQEEVGLDLTRALLIGELDDLAPRTPTLPPIVVTPFVFRLDGELPAVTPNHEVAAAMWTPLDQLLAPGMYRPFAFDYQGATLAMPGYHLEGGVVWGMTERILTPLLSLMSP
jgi:8-oxo-dGTP pyrophosphatase MutT (NUDIX family)